MHSVGIFAPETVETAREQYDALRFSAQTVVREIAKAMSFDRDEYQERVTTDVVMTAREALFASLLEVTVGTREEFDEWCTDRNDEVELAGNENVDHVVWHPIPFAGVIVAATFQNEETAAVGTLQRQAFGRHYRNAFEEHTTDE